MSDKQTNASRYCTIFQTPPINPQGLAVQVKVIRSYKGLYKVCKDEVSGLYSHTVAGLHYPFIYKVYTCLGFLNHQQYHTQINIYQI